MVLGLIDDLRAAGWSDVTLVSQPASFLEDQARQRGLAFIGFDFFGTAFDPTLSWRLARRLGGSSFALSHLHGLRAAHHVLGWPARHRLGATVYTVHGLHQLHLARPLRWLANVADRRVMRRVDAAVFVSRDDERLAGVWKLLPPRASAGVVYNGIDVESLARCARPDPLRDIDVVFIGRHVEQKAPEIAATALAALAAQGRRCVMAGGGPLLAHCRELLNRLPGGRRVESLGELPRDAALHVLARARTLVMPSRWEGLPLLPMEAMALGVLVVASRLPGIAEVLGDDAGLLTEPGDASALVPAVQALLGDPGRARRQREAASRRVGELFDRARCSARYGQLYSALAATR